MTETTAKNNPPIRERLHECFSIVFPNLPANEIYIASVSSVSMWDSLAMLTLVGVIEEEFGISIDLGDIEQFLSFELTASFIENELSA